MWPASTRVKLLYRSTIVKTIHEPEGWSPVIYDDTNTLHVEEEDLKTAINGYMPKEQAMINLHRKICDYDIHTMSLDSFEQDANDLRASISNLKKRDYLPEVLRPLLSGSTNVKKSLDFLSQQMKNLNIMRDDVGHAIERLQKHNNFFEAGPSCMVFTQDLARTALFTGAVASCLGMCFVCKLPNGKIGSALLHLNDHFAVSVFTHSREEVKTVVKVIVSKVREKLQIDVDTELFAYVVGGQMHDEDEFALRSCYYASTVFAEENGWDGIRMPLSDFYNKKDDLKDSLNGLNGREIRRYYKSWRDSKMLHLRKHVEIYKSYSTANTDYISKKLQQAYLSYMKEEEPFSLHALEDGQDFPVFFETLLSTQKCRVLRRPYNLPSNLGAYDSQKMQPLTIAISVQQKIPMIIVTRSQTPFNTGKNQRTLQVKRNDDRLGHKIGIGIPSIVLDDFAGQQGEIPLGFLELRIGTDKSEDFLVHHS